MNKLIKVIRRISRKQRLANALTKLDETLNGTEQNRFEILKKKKRS